jgi:hypothetical protein
VKGRFQIHDDANRLRTILRFSKALAYKDAGDPEKARKIMGISSLRNGKIYVEPNLLGNYTTLL